MLCGLPWGVTPIIWPGIETPSPHQVPADQIFYKARPLLPPLLPYNNKVLVCECVGVDETDLLKQLSGSRCSSREVSFIYQEFCTSYQPIISNTIPQTHQPLHLQHLFSSRAQIYGLARLLGTSANNHRKVVRIHRSVP